LVDPNRTLGATDPPVYSSIMQGVVKVYDPATGVGVIVREDTRDQVMLRPGSLDGSIFRVLRQGQRVNFDLDPDDGVDYAKRLRFGSDGY